MNLTNLFNFSYLKENLKKSKVTLTFVLLILPILNFIILLMCGMQDTVQVFALNEISGFTIFGMYIVPIVLSILLFGFVFKKKSVDFMGSMPIDRKTIFFTNTLGGIIILLALIFITMLFMMIAAVVLPNLYIPTLVFWDYFIVFSISYIFVFTACNIALSVSGNVFTTLIVTALILFFIPFHHYAFKNIIDHYHYYNLTYECEDCVVDHYQETMCDGDSQCLQELNTGEYNVYLSPLAKNDSYTMPFQVISRILNYDMDDTFYDSSMLGKMALLILLYIFVGSLLFERREMEVCETSFKKFSTHQIVKAFTLIPIFVLICVALEGSSLLAWIFAICLVLVYNFVYDLMTRHSIIKVFKNLGLVAGVFLFVFTIVLLYGDKNETTIESFQIEDVSKVQVDLSEFSAFSQKQLVSIQDKDLQFKILEGLIPNYSEVEEEELYYVEVELLIRGRRYQGITMLDDSNYQKLQEEILASKDYWQVTPKEVLKKQEIITLGNNYGIFDQQGIDILKDVLKEDIGNQETFSIPIDIYTYEDHELKGYRIYSNLHDDLQKYSVEKINEKLRKVNFDKVSYIEFIRVDSSSEYEYYLKDSTKVKFVLNEILKDSMDFTKPIYKAQVYSDNQYYIYYTNLSDTVSSLLVSSKGGYYGG